MTTVMITTGGTAVMCSPGSRCAAKLARARRPRVLARHARRHRVEARAAARRRVRGPVVSRRARQGPAHVAARSVRAARRRASPRARSSAAACPTSCSASAASPRSPAGSWARRRASRWCCTTRTPSPASPRACSRTAPIASCSAFRRRCADATPSSWNGSAIRCATRSARLPPPAQRFAGRSGPLRLLVVGGSLGAQAMNELVPAAIASIAARRSGRRSCIRPARSTSRRCARPTRALASTAECVAFIDDMAARYAWADFVICRGGALTISELAAVGLGALVVPLPGAIADEQSANAQFLVDARRRVAGAAGNADAAAPAGAPAIARPRARTCDGASRARARQARCGRARGRSVHRVRERAHEAQGQARALRGHRRRRA